MLLHFFHHLHLKQEQPHLLCSNHFCFSSMWNKSHSWSYIKTSSLHIKPNHFFTKELVTNRYLFALYFLLNYECMYNYVISLSRIPIPINKEIWPIVCEILVLLPLPSGCFPVFVSCNFLGGVGSQICERIFLHTSLKLFTQQSTLSTWILHIGVKKKKKKNWAGHLNTIFAPRGWGGNSNKPDSSAQRVVQGEMLKFQIDQHIHNSRLIKGNRVHIFICLYL